MVFLALWAAFLIPLTALTGQNPGPSRPSAESVADEPVDTWTTLRFSVAPRSFVLRQQDRVLWREDQPDGQAFEKELPLALSGEQAELLLEIVWPDASALKAAELSLAPDGRVEKSQTLWQQDAEAGDIVRFQW